MEILSIDALCELFESDRHNFNKISQGEFDYYVGFALGGDECYLHVADSPENFRKYCSMRINFWMALYNLITDYHCRDVKGKAKSASVICKNAIDYIKKMELQGLDNLLFNRCAKCNIGATYGKECYD